MIHAALKRLAPGGNLAFFRALVAAGGGVLRGEHMLAGFIAMKPDNEIARQMQLLANLDDVAHRERYREFEDWFKHTQAIPGAFYLWIVEHLFRDNALIAGELEVRGEHVELGRIECPLNLLAGAADHITPPDQVFALADYATTPSEQIVRETTAGGHLGLFMGHEALRDHWPRLLAAVRARSAPKVPTREIRASAGAPALIHDHRCAGERAPIGSEQESDGRRHLLGLDQPLDGLRREDHLLEHAVLGQAVGLRLVGDLALDERRAHVGGAHGGGADPVLGALERERLDEPDHAVLGRDVGRLVRRGHEPVDGGDRDEPSGSRLAPGAARRSGRAGTGWSAAAR